MSGIISDQAHDFTAPAQDSITVFTLTALTASAEQDTLIGSSESYPIQNISFGCDQIWYMTAGTAGSITTPVISATGSNAARTMGPFPAGVTSFRVYPATRYFKVISASSATFRFYHSTGTGQVGW